MEIKETIYTKVDDKGRVIEQTRTVDVKESNTDYGYDYGTLFGEYGNPHRSSFKRIYESYSDYRCSQQW